jgi:hypothetical protein
MPKVSRDLLDPEQVQKLLNYYHSGTNNINTGEAIRQRINFDDPAFPKDTIISVLDSMLEQPYQIEYLVFIHSQRPFGIHTHGDVKKTNLYNIVTIQLESSDDSEQSGTVFFDNYLEGAPAGFDKRSHNSWPVQIKQVIDYSILSNYVKTDFPTELYEKYLSHLPIDNVNGLTFDQYVEWTPGSAMSFPRSQLHCAASGNSKKISILVATLTK